MRKVGNPLLVATDVPGHHRPILTKQLKCQSLHCGIADWEGKTPGQLGCQSNLRCGKDARVTQSNGRESARLRPKQRLFPRQAATCIRRPIKAAPYTGTILQESEAVSQPCQRLKR